jgi:hypothetical protein
MYPQLFLRTFWQMQFKPQVFVAMSFDDKYKSRFEDIIAPAIRLIEVDGVSLKPYRVDISKTGDSILTDINDGIAHSQLVLADVSSIGKDSITGQPYRNANVMYEVGLALACRQPMEILLVRDDHDKFLFDVSTIPHMTIDFTDEDLAVKTLKEKLEERIKERYYINDARVQLAVAGMIKQEVDLVRILGDMPLGKVWVQKKEKQWDPFGVDQSPRLLDKQVLYFAGQTKEGHPSYRLTPLGFAVAEFLKKR